MGIVPLGNESIRGNDMKMFFKTRKEMRQFKGKAKKVDQGNKARADRRWAVQVA